MRLYSAVKKSWMTHGPGLIVGLLILFSVAPALAQSGGPAGAVDGQTPKFIDVDGARTRYYDVGQGDVVLLIHGARPSGRSSANAWGPVLGELGKHFRVLAPDRLGHGMTENPKGEYSAAAEMNHLYAFLKALHVDKVYAVGQSTGSYHAARVALEHPDIVRALVLCDSATLSPPMGDVRARRAAIGLGTGAGPQSAGTPRDQARKAMIALSVNKGHITDEFLDAAEFMASQPGGKKTDAAMKTDAAKAYEKGIAAGAAELRDWIKQGRLQMPTLLYWGKNDPSAILPIGLALFDMISEHDKRAEMIIVNDAGHFHFREHPKDFAGNVTQFLTRAAETQ